MRTSVTFVLACLSFFVNACGSVIKSDLPQIKEDEVPPAITNYLTEQYKDIPGTKLSLLVPDSFVYDGGLGGWSSSSKNAWIIASSLQTKPLLAAGSYKSRLTDRSRPDALEGTLLQEWSITVNARPSKLFKVQTALGGDDHLQYVLFIGDSASGYRVTGSIHEDELSRAPQLRKSLLSIFYDAERQVGAGAQTSASPCNCEKDKKK